MPAALPSRASVVVAGGGAMGTSVAFHLAEAGVEDVLLLERAELASGSTSKAAGGVRAQFSDELNVAIALRSLEAYGAFGVRPGWQIDLRRVGYLFSRDGKFVVCKHLPEGFSKKRFAGKAGKQQLSNEEQDYVLRAKLRGEFPPLEAEGYGQHITNFDRAEEDRSQNRMEGK